MTFRKLAFTSWMVLMLAARCAAQNQSEVPTPITLADEDETESERWNLYSQATSIGDYHGTFRAPYEGPLSLQNHMERDVSLTSTLFWTARLQRDSFLVFNPEI